MVIMMVKNWRACTDVLEFDTSAIWERRLCKVFQLFPHRRNISVTFPLKDSSRIHTSLSNMAKTGRCLTKSSPPHVVQVLIFIVLQAINRTDTRFYMIYKSKLKCKTFNKLVNYLKLRLKKNYKFLLKVYITWNLFSVYAFIILITANYCYGL